MMKATFFHAVRLCSFVFAVVFASPLHAGLTITNATVDGITYKYAIVNVEDGKGVMLLGNIPKSGRCSLSDYSTAISPVPEELTIPDSIGGLPVNVIGVATFANAAQLRKVKIPDSVKWIDPLAFGFCTNLESVVMPKRAYRIRDMAFAGCSRLEKITIPEGVRDICKSTFADCQSLKTVYLPDSVTNIGVKAFHYCENLRRDRLPKYLVNIGDAAFYACNRLTQMEIPESVQSIGLCAFACCTNLSRVKILSSLDELASTFLDDTGLTSVEIHGKIGKLNTTFSGCSNLCNIVGLRNVNRIDDRTFERIVFDRVEADTSGAKIYDGWLVGFPNTTNAVFNIPDETKIVDGVFRDLPPNSTVNLGDCPHVEDYYITVEPGHRIGSFRGMFQGCTNLVRLSIARHFKSVPMSLCEGCTNLLEVQMWDGYEDMNGRVFTGCTNLLHFTLPKVPTFTSEWWNKSVPPIVQDRMYRYEPYNYQLQCLYLADAEQLVRTSRFDLKRAMACHDGLKYFIEQHQDANAAGMDKVITCLKEAMFGLAAVKGKVPDNLSGNLKIDPCQIMEYSLCKMIASTYEDAVSLEILGDYDRENGNALAAVDNYKRAARAYAKLVIKELKEQKKVDPYGLGLESSLRPRDCMTGCVDAIARIGYKTTAESLLTELDEMIERGSKKATASQMPSMCTGTGWTVNESHIATCWHVLERARKISCELSDGTRLPLEIVAHDASSDVAVLKLKSSVRLQTSLPILTKTAKTAERVFTVGYPLASLLGQSQKYSEGTISATTGIGNDGRMYQISVPIQSGNSGGALVNESGFAVGLTASGLNAWKTLQVTGSMPQNVNYAIKVRYLAAILDDNDIPYSTSGKGSEPLSREQAVRLVERATVLILAE